MDCRLKYSYDYSFIREKSISTYCVEVSNTLLGAQMSIMLQHDHMVTFGAVLLSSRVVLPVRKRRNMPYSFISNSIDFIVFYRSSLHKNTY